MRSDQPVCWTSTAILPDIRACSLIRRSNIFCLHCGVNYTHTGLETPACVYPLKESWKHQKGLKEPGPSLLWITAGAVGLASFLSGLWDGSISEGRNARVWVTVQTWAMKRSLEHSTPLPKGNKSVNMGSIWRHLSFKSHHEEPTVNLANKLILYHSTILPNFLDDRLLPAASTITCLSANFNEEL